MKSVEILFGEKRARLVVEKGKYDPAAAEKALKAVDLGGGTRVN